MTKCCQVSSNFNWFCAARTSSRPSIGSCRLGGQPQPVSASAIGRHGFDRAPPDQRAAGSTFGADPDQLVAILIRRPADARRRAVRNEPKWPKDYRTISSDLMIMILLLVYSKDETGWAFPFEQGFNRQRLLFADINNSLNMPKMISSKKSG